MRDSDTSGPLTFGQLYIWRNAEPYPRGVLGEVNVFAVIDVPHGAAATTVTDAITMIEQRHEILRTRYEMDDRTGLPRQVVLARSGVTPRTVEGRRDEIDRLCDEAGTWSQQAPIDPLSRPPWELTMTMVEGRPTNLVIVAHHVMLDWISLERLTRELSGLLRGESPRGSPGRPLAIARAQRSADWAGHRDEANRYWQRLLPRLPWRQAPPVWAGTPPERSRWHQPLLRSAALAGALRRVARRWDVSGSAPILALTAIALWREFGWDHPVLSLMSANRWLSRDMQHALCCTAQPVPLVVAVDPGEPVGAFIQRVHRDSTRAYRSGCYDLDDTHTFLGRACTRSDLLFHQQFIVNYVASAASGPVDDAIVGSSRSWLPDRETGPNGLLVHDEGRTLSLWLRLDARLLTREQAARLLHAMERVATHLDGETPVAGIAQHPAWSATGGGSTAVTGRLVPAVR